jgi:hypothetical protein
MGEENVMMQQHIVQDPQELQELPELCQKFNPHWYEILNNPDSASVFKMELPFTLKPEQVAKPGTDERRVWELIGLYFRSRQRWYDAILIYQSMYEHFLKLQEVSWERVKKGVPLIWMAECYFSLGFLTLSKRYLMLTLVEDAIFLKGEIDPLNTGSYYRLAWMHGLTDNEIKEYSEQAYKIGNANPAEAMFPEWVLQELNQDWIVEVPGPNEVAQYKLNEIYVKYLIDGLGESSGKNLERLAGYLLSCMPGCKTSRRNRPDSSNFDVVCSLQGPDVDFRSELGRYFVVDCKDWSTPVDFSSFAIFCRVLDSVKSQFGIIFSKFGIADEGKNSNAEKEQQKIFQDRGMVIIVVNEADLAYVSYGGNFMGLLRNKYEKVRLDLRPQSPA